LTLSAKVILLVISDEVTSTSTIRLRKLSTITRFRLANREGLDDVPVPGISPRDRRNRRHV